MGYDGRISWRKYIKMDAGLNLQKLRRTKTYNILHSLTFKSQT